MTTEQQNRWNRIRNFPIDAANASFPYSTRLARENGWTPVYAERVIDEYRKFAFLAVAAGHGVTPSKAVDEAWHLHLLYTQNYWNDFCPNALGQALHHNPADGSTGDDSKYEGWYENTLKSYERLFESPPPGDIWPKASEPALPTRSRWAFLSLLGFALVGCGEPANPLDWHGPQFLQLFWMLFLGAVLVAFLVRQKLLGTDEGPPAQDWRLGVYEQAYLNGGNSLALGTALARLTALKFLDVDRKTGKIQNIAPDERPDHPLDRSILTATLSGGVTYDKVAQRVSPILAGMEQDLRRQGLWVSEDRKAASASLPFLIAGLPLLLGLVKIFVGLDRERPVGFLIASCLVGLAVNVAFLIPPKRSPYGDRVLEELRNRHPGRPTRSAATEPEVLASGMALFGMSLLASTEYAHLKRAITPQPVSSGDGGSSSSCGGSSGCGGGGCGGGGCGGCGS